MGPDIIARDAHRHETAFLMTEQPQAATLPSQALDGDEAHALQALATSAWLLFYELRLRAALQSDRNFTLQAWLASAGLDIKTIGIFSLVGLPYIFKFLWAPLLDRYLPPLLGRRRGWILIFQACLAICHRRHGFLFADQGTLCARRHCACWWSFLSASQDIVIDAYRVDTIPAERARPGRRGDRVRLSHGGDAGGRGAGADRRAASVGSWPF